MCPRVKTTPFPGCLWCVFACMAPSGLGPTISHLEEVQTLRCGKEERKGKKGGQSSLSQSIKSPLFLGGPSRPASQGSRACSGCCALLVRLQKCPSSLLSVPTPASGPGGAGHPVRTARSSLPLACPLDGDSAGLEGLTPSTARSEAATAPPTWKPTRPD